MTQKLTVYYNCTIDTVPYRICSVVKVLVELNVENNSAVKVPTGRTLRMWVENNKKYCTGTVLVVSRLML